MCICASVNNSNSYSRLYSLYIFFFLPFVALLFHGNIVLCAYSPFSFTFLCGDALLSHFTRSAISLCVWVHFFYFHVYRVVSMRTFGNLFLAAGCNFCCYWHRLFTNSWIRLRFRLCRLAVSHISRMKWSCSRHKCRFQNVVTMLFSPLFCWCVCVCVCDL